MLRIADILQPAHVELDLVAANAGEAIHRVASLLRDDPKVVNWQLFYSDLKGGERCIEAGTEFRICLPHARTPGVSSIVMAVGRAMSGIQFGETSARYIFVVGVPNAMAANYLRVIGALARILSDSKRERVLREVKTPEEFVNRMAEFEMDL